MLLKGQKVILEKDCLAQTTNSFLFVSNFTEKSDYFQSAHRMDNERIRKGIFAEF